MQKPFFGSWRMSMSALFVLAMTSGCAASTTITMPHLRSGLIQVDVHDRASGTVLPVHQKDERHYIVGAPGHEYAVRIRNCTGARVLVVTSVDGVNVISGETASPSQSGYVLDPWGSVEIKGWRKNLQRTAAFYFTEHQNSYAARTGRPDNVGVIGVGVFREKAQPVARPEPLFRRGQIASENQPESPRAQDSAQSAAESPASAPAANEGDVRAPRQRLEAADAARTLGKLGTGHGRNEASRATLVRFERASEVPAETVSLQYDRRENLVAIGVLPPYPSVARREPQPFPAGMRFAPDPNP